MLLKTITVKLQPLDPHINNSQYFYMKGELALCANHISRFLKCGKNNKPKKLILKLFNSKPKNFNTHVTKRIWIQSGFFNSYWTTSFRQRFNPYNMLLSSTAEWLRNHVLIDDYSMKPKQFYLQIIPIK